MAFEDTQEGGSAQTDSDRGAVGVMDKPISTPQGTKEPRDGAYRVMDDPAGVLSAEVDRGETGLGKKLGEAINRKFDDFHKPGLERVISTSASDPNFEVMVLDWKKAIADERGFKEESTVKIARAKGSEGDASWMYNEDKTTSAYLNDLGQVEPANIENVHLEMGRDGELTYTKTRLGGKTPEFSTIIYSHATPDEKATVDALLNTALSQLTS